jgi:hypothetical protein
MEHHNGIVKDSHAESLTENHWGTVSAAAPQ